MAEGHFPSDNIKLLTNENATRGQIVEAIEWMGRRVTSEDLVYIFFAGHGEIDGQGRAYFMPYNADPSLPYDLGLRADRFLEDLKTSITAKQMVFFIDACHAGAALVPGGTTGSSRSSGKNVIPNILGLWQKFLSDSDAINMGILSAGSNQLSWEDHELEHGLFTYFLIKGMEGAADIECDGTITAQALFRYVTDNVEKRSKELYSEQTPIVSPSWEPRFPLAMYAVAPSTKRPCVPAVVAPGGTPKAAPIRSSSFRESRAAIQFESVRGESARLVQFLHGMPKGADLHVHLSGAVYAESLIRAGVEDGLCVNLASLSFAKPRRPIGGEKGMAACNDGEVPVAQINHDQSLYNSLVNSFSMRHYVPSAGSTGYDQLYGTFSKFGGLDQRHLGEWIDELASHAAIQNEQYLEIMHTPDFSNAAKIASSVGWQPDFYRFREELLRRGIRDDLLAARESIDRAESLRRERENCGQHAELPACDVQIRYLYQVLRGLPKELVFVQALVGFELASMDPRFVGVNFVMPEDSVTSMSDYKLHMQILNFMHCTYPAVHNKPPCRRVVSWPSAANWLAVSYPRCC